LNIKVLYGYGILMGLLILSVIYHYTCSLEKLWMKIIKN